MRPLIDFSSQLTVDSTTWEDDQVYEYQNPTNDWILIDEISVQGDSTFLSQGEVIVEFSGNSITSEGSAATAIAPLANFTLTRRAPSLWWVEPNSSVVVRTRLSSAGSANAQVLVTGSRMSYEEAQQLKQRYGVQ